MKKVELDLMTLAGLFTDEEAARKFFEGRRWPNGPTCSHCGGAGYPLTPREDSKHPVRSGVFKCSGCKKQFTVTTGTVFEGSRVGLHKWLAATHMMVSSKKGVSAAQLERQLGVTYRTAWFLLHRLREAMAGGDIAGLLGGGGRTVEADETYIGGRKPRGVKGRGGVGKAPVQAIIEQHGNVVAIHAEGMSATELRRNVKKTVRPDSRIDTDETLAYRGIDRAFAGGHKTVNHSERFVDPTTGATTNTCECYFSLVKRSHYGVFHVWSKKHLQAYLGERSFHWNHRRKTDGERLVALIGQVGGKRLTYKRLVKG